MNDNIIRVLLVGCGGFARNCLPPLIEDHRFKIVGMVDPMPGNLREAAAIAVLSEAQLFTSDTEAYCKMTADLAVINSPVSAHFDNASLALKRGLNVFMAKPFTETLEQAQSLIKLEKETGRWIAIGQTARFAPENLRIQELLQAGVLGDLGFANLYEYRNRTFHLQDYQLAESWPVINATLIHDIDVLRMLLGRNPVRVSAKPVQSAAWNPYRDPGAFTGWIEFEKGLVVGLFRSFVSKSSFASMQSNAHTPMVHLMIQGHRGMLTYRCWCEPLKRQIQISRCSDDNGEAIGAIPLETIDISVNPDGVVAFHDLMRRLQDQLAVSCRSGKAVFCDAADNIQSLAAIKAIEMSARRNGEPMEVAGLLKGTPV
jgi:predicted dehydrogenase